MPMSTSRTTVVFTVILMVVVIVGLDVLLLRHHFWLRLLSNVGIVGLVGVSYVTVVRHGSH